MRKVGRPKKTKKFRNENVLFFAYPQIEATLLEVKRWCEDMEVDYADIKEEILADTWQQVDRLGSPYHESVFQVFLGTMRDFVKQYVIT